MDWSWEGLERDEQTVLSVLSECHGGWTLDAAEGLCSDLVTTPITTVLRSLTAKSMINPTRTASGTRYRMLETVRLFGQQKLVDLELSEWAHRAHSAWYAGWVRATPLDERLFWQPWIRQSVDELENLHTAFNWAIEAGQLSDAVTLHAAMKGPINSDGGSRERLPLGTAALGTRLRLARRSHRPHDRHHGSRLRRRSRRHGDMGCPSRRTRPARRPMPGGPDLRLSSGYRRRPRP